MGQFYYTQLRIAPPTEEGGKQSIIKVEDSFDIDEIQRTQDFPDGSRVVFLKDGHEEDRDEDYQSKNGVKGTRKARVFVQGQIRLMPPDARRLRALTEILLPEEIEQQLGGERNEFLQKLKSEIEGEQEQEQSLIVGPETPIDQPSDN